jgi:sigma-B regulation protein RsbU (phosphoserine phosphatase)
VPDIKKMRKYERHQHEATIMFTCSPDHSFCFYGAKMMNHSIGGVYFESRYSVEPGTIISFSKAVYTVDSYESSVYKTHRVKVKWCSGISDNQEPLFGIGAEYMDPSMLGEKAPMIMDEIPAPSDTEQGELPGSASALIDKLDRDPTDMEQKLKQAKEEAESTASELATLNRFAAKVSSTLDLDEILQSICRETTHIFGARNTGIGLLNKKRTHLSIVAFYSADPDETDLTGLSMPLEGNAATHRVVETGHAVVIPDVQNNPLTASIHDIAKKRGTECLMILPLMTRGEVIGTIGMPTSDKNRIFTIEEVSVAQTIASQIASAIENARLFGKTEKAKKLAEHELEIGRQIQTEFFPETLPQIAGWEFSAYYQPSREVTGDFYDVMQLGKEQFLGLVMADVCDHGVGSALFMVLFRSLIRAFAEQSFEAFEHGAPNTDMLIEKALHRTITQTNRYIANTHSLSGMFASVFCGVLEHASGRLFYINGGHEMPLIISHKGIEARLNPTGPVLGLEADISYKVNTIDLEQRHALFAFTDGVADAKNQDGERFTKRRLIEHLQQQAFTSAQSMLESIQTALALHSAGEDQFDDITMLAVYRP